MVSAKSPFSTPSFSARRTVRIRVVDPKDALIRGARIVLSFDGRSAGSLFTTGNRETTLEVSDPRLEIGLEAELSGQKQFVILGAQQDFFEFRFEGGGSFAFQHLPVIRCPNGVTGSPCVTCRDGAVIWRMCA